MARFGTTAEGRLATLAGLLKHGECFEIARRLCGEYLSPRFALLGKSHLMLREGDGAPCESSAQSLCFRNGSEDDLGGLLECTGSAGSSITEHVFRGFFAAGHRCYVLQTPEQIISYCWLFSSEYIVTHDDYETSKVVFALNEDSAFIGNVFTRPEWRRRGCYGSLLSGVLREAKASHRTRRFYVTVKADAITSIVAHTRLGFGTVATLYYIGLLGARFLVVAPAQDRLRVCRVAGRPVMTL